MHKPALVALLLAACGGPPAAGFSSGPGSTSASASTRGTSTSEDTSSTLPGDDSAGSSSAANLSTGILRDVGSPNDFGPVQPEGCKGKVDLLFLISSFGTMGTEQAHLLASFEGFVTTIEDKLADFDVHIMAANPIGKWPGWVCEKGCNDDPQNCAAYGYQCNVYPKLITPCDETLGAGITLNAGDYAANRPCELFGGNRYIISGEPDLPDALECIAKVGAGGGIPGFGGRSTSMIPRSRSALFSTRWFASSPGSARRSSSTLVCFSLALVVVFFSSFILWFVFSPCSVNAGALCLTRYWQLGPGHRVAVTTSRAGAIEVGARSLVTSDRSRSLHGWRAPRRCRSRTGRNRREAWRYGWSSAASSS